MADPAHVNVDEQIKELGGVLSGALHKIGALSWSEYVAAKEERLRHASQPGPELIQGGEQRIEGVELSQALGPVIAQGHSRLAG